MVVPAVLVETMTVQYSAGWNFLAFSCVARLTRNSPMKSSELIA
jgi:hypothetical protein